MKLGKDFHIEKCTCVINAMEEAKNKIVSRRSSDAFCID